MLLIGSTIIVKPELQNSFKKRTIRNLQPLDHHALPRNLHLDRYIEGKRVKVGMK